MKLGLGGVIALVEIASAAALLFLIRQEGLPPEIGVDIFSASICLLIGAVSQSVFDYIKERAMKIVEQRQVVP